MGAESPAWMRAATLAVAAALPRAQRVTLQGQGHSAMFTAPEIFAREVIRFAAAA
jgi:pimeloyl-ACP methyl ester carboxylesterase